MKTEAHQRYQDPEGRYFPSVTTALGVLDKPYLVKWANNLGLKGIDSSRFTEERSEIGTLAHHLILCDMEGDLPDIMDYSPNQLAMAEHALTLYRKWKEVYKPVPILMEKHLVSTRYGYGGTLDMVADLTIGNHVCRELVDFKTSKYLSNSYYAQLAAYNQLLTENGMPVENCRLLRIGVEPDECAFEERQLLHLDKYFRLFLLCLSIYNLHLT
jgi:hypothetical protein